MNSGVDTRDLAAFLAVARERSFTALCSKSTTGV